MCPASVTETAPQQMRFISILNKQNWERVIPAKLSVDLEINTTSQSEYNRLKALVTDERVIYKISNSITGWGRVREFVTTIARVAESERHRCSTTAYAMSGINIFNARHDDIFSNSMCGTLSGKI